MSKPNLFRTERNSSPRSKRRRPTGVSRRQHRKQLGFETLEDRRVMSAQSPLASLQGQVDDGIGIQVSSLSSNTTSGLLSILQNELNWQSLQNTGATSAASASRSIPSDPLLNDQWHLINTGQQVGSPDFQTIFAIPGEDINVASVWNQNIFGEGVVVGVFETGGFFETTHPDLDDNTDPLLSYDAGGSTGVSRHATSVAGLIGAEANNIGGTGVAPGVTLVPLGGAGVSDITNALGFRYAADNGVDIVNNSWGPSDVFRSLGGMSATEIQALRDTIIFGRDGKGLIYVWASGNGAGADFDQGFASLGSWDTAAYDGYVNSRYTIGVTGVDHDGFYNNIDGTITSYPEISTGVLVAAPTGSVSYSIADDTGIGSGIVTTDVTGEGGYNSEGFISDRDFLEDTDYTSRFAGTSASAPIASGVIALMLEANPDLSWRDVQEILVRSARQNAEFDIPSTVGLGSTQNTWIVNQMPVFHDPDAFDPTVDPAVQTLTPTLDPSLSRPGRGLHYQPTPQVLTNSAGYTVSQGVSPGAENIGYAHGVIDAELAVALSQQWHSKKQDLPDELTFTTFVSPTQGPDINISAAEKGNLDSGFQLVPGGIGGTPGGGFIPYWDQYFADEPFNNFTNNNTRGGFLNFTVPDSNLMTVENIEVKLSISGANAEFMDHARVLLVSPNGTHSELNQFWVEPDLPFTLQNASVATISGEPVSVDPDTGNFVWTFTSNRNWGERSDNAILFDPTTNEPATGSPISQNWQLHIENYDSTNAFGLAGLEIAWHGSPINNTGTQRLQGLVGVDDNQDDVFDFARTTVNNVDLNSDGIVRYGDVFSTINTSHESMGANVTVTAARASDGVVVAQFVTGADGNYYFDLVPDDYIISVEDADGRVAVDDTLSAAGFLKDFQSEWLVTSDFFNVWDYDTSLEVPINSITNAPFAFGATATPYHVNHINFLLDPGAPAAPQVDFSGSIFTDVNGDGVFNTGDVALPGVGVFGDVNRNGEFDAGEILVTTDASGQYSLTVPTNTTSVINVGVRPPSGWTATNPSSGFQSFFSELGDTFTGVDFHIQPPATDSVGDGSANSGVILGTVFNDKNGNMSRDTDETGVPNQTVYLDMNNSGAIDAGDFVTQTNSNGAYAFTNVPNGSHYLRMDLDPLSGISQTFPDFDLPQFANILSGGTDVSVDFGVNNGSGSGGGGGIFDFGDLPDVYGTRLADDGPRHPEGSVFLGTAIDAEPDAHASSDAKGDDDNFLADDDGVVLVGGTLIEGSTGSLIATASVYGGYLQAWMDFNNNGNFEASEQVITNELLVQGANTVTFNIPADLISATVFARFRLGEYGLGKSGVAQIGEVEDYALPVDAGSFPLVFVNGPDFDNDGDVDGSDFLSWQRGSGTTSNATSSQGDANTDGAVDGDDLAIMLQDYGQGSPALVISTGDFDSDGDTDGSDFLAFQRGVSLPAALSTGDGNRDGVVNGTDLQSWDNSYGDGSASAASHSAVVAASFSSAVARGPVVSQPGFREDLVAGVADTTIVDNAKPIVAVDRVNIASLASGFDRQSTRGQFAAPVRQAGYRLDEAQPALAAERAELGLALRDRVWEEISSKRQSVVEETEQFDAEEALAEAFGEEINWRL